MIPGSRLHRQTLEVGFNWVLFMDLSSPIQIQRPKPLDAITTEGEGAVHSLSSFLRERWDKTNSDTTRAEIMRFSGKIVDYVVGLRNAGAVNHANKVVRRYHDMLTNAEYFR